MMLLLDILDWIFVFVLGLPVLYLFVFAAASTRSRKDTYPPARRQRRFVTLIPAYKSDAVIVRTAQAALQQDYPQELHEVVVIADRLQPATLAELRRMPIRVLEASFENSSKARALNFAVGEIGPDGAEAVAILDADNLAGREFIARMNDALDSGIQAVQAHRTAKNRDTDTAVLDAASEEVNNSIFRRGHVALGFSSALIGSGMAFDYKWFRENIACCTTSGEDKELEALLLRQGIYIDYLDDVRVLDEKVQGEGAYYNQRRRWIAAQFYALSSAVRQLPGAILSGNTDYCDKLLQWCLPPRILLLGLVPLWAVVMTVCAPMGSIKWWVAVLLLLLAMAMAPGARPPADARPVPADAGQPLPAAGHQRQIHPHRTYRGRKRSPRKQYRKPTMKIAIEAQRIFRPNKHGMDFVALETIRCLQRLDTKNEYFIFTGEGEDRCLEESPNMHITTLRCPSYPLWEQWALPRAVARVKPDLLHCTSNTAPVWGKAPLVLTLHDIIFLEEQAARNKSLYQSLGRIYRRLVVPRILPRCRMVVTVSQFECDRIRTALNFDPERIMAIHNGYNDRFRPMEGTAETVCKYLQDPEFLFFLGNTDPKKNTPGTLKAYAEYVRRSEKPLPLLIADLGEQPAEAILREIGEPRLRGMLRLAGYIPNSDLPAIYNRASAFLYTSLRESFGIPQLEAMACGTPVVTSATSAIPEVAGEGAILVDPTDPKAIADALLRLETDAAFRARQVAYGLDRVKQFSWEKTARHLLTLYESLGK